MTFRRIYYWDYELRRVWRWWTWRVPFARPPSFQDAACRAIEAGEPGRRGPIPIPIRATLFP